MKGRLEVKGYGVVDLTSAIDDNNQPFYEVHWSNCTETIAWFYTDEKFGNEFFMMELEACLEAYLGY